MAETIATTPRSYGSGSGMNQELYIIEVRTVLDESIRVTDWYSVTRKWSRFPLQNGQEGDIQIAPSVSLPYRFPSLHFIEAHEKLLEFDQAYAFAVWLQTHFDIMWMGEQRRFGGPIEVRLVKVTLTYSYSVAETGVGPTIEVKDIRHAMQDEFKEREVGAAAQEGK